MQTKTNWFKTALAQEQSTPQGFTNPSTRGGQSEMSYSSNPGQTETNSPVEPKPTPTPAQKAEQGKQQRVETDRLRQVSVPEVANRVLPSLNAALHNLVNEVLSINLPEPAARGLAIEIMAAFVAASKNGPVSEMTSVIVKSPRINRVLDTVS